jgi:hypothetical protein
VAGVRMKNNCNIWMAFEFDATTVSEAQPVELGFLPYARQPSKNVPFRSTEKLKARRHRDNGAAILRLIRSSQNCCYNVVIKETDIYT